MNLARVQLHSPKKNLKTLAVTHPSLVNLWVGGFPRLRAPATCCPVFARETLAFTASRPLLSTSWPLPASTTWKPRTSGADMYSSCGRFPLRTIYAHDTPSHHQGKPMENHIQSSKRSTVAWTGTWLSQRAINQRSAVWDDPLGLVPCLPSNLLDLGHAT